MPANIVVHVTQHTSVLQSALPIAATTISALAAGASWMSVRLSRRTQVEADLPQLLWHITRSESALQPGFPVTLTIENVGRGVAIFTGFVVLSGDGRAVNRYVERHLAQGDHARFGLPFETTTASVSVAFCEDRRNNLHVWSNERPRYECYKPDKRQDLTGTLLMEAMHPGRGQEFEASNSVAAQPLAD